MPLSWPWTSPPALNGRSGKPQPEAIRADATVSFGAIKLGLVLPHAAPYVGEVICRDIGIPRQCIESTPPKHFGIAAEIMERIPAPPPELHKGRAGHLLILGGSPGLTGAPHLAALGALRAGCGLVTVACPGALAREIKADRPEIMTLPLGKGSCWDWECLNALAPRLGSFHALAVGPGLGRNLEALDFLKGLCRNLSLPCVFDADALFHLATAWTPGKDVPVGDVVIGYDDGTETRYVVTVGRDVGNWFVPTNLGERRDWLERRQPPFPHRPLCHQDPAGTTRGAVGSPRGLGQGRLDGRRHVRRRGRRSLAGERTRVRLPNEDWRAFEHRVTTEPGSVLDFSSLLDGPAGKYGPVIAKGGHFAFRDAPDKRIRFYGTNICSRAGFQDKAGGEALVAELARKGYNSARLHHFGALLPFREGTSSTEFDPAELDKLDYLFHCLKRQGLYVNIDLYTTRTVRKGEIPEVDRDVRLNEFKALVGLSPSAMRNCRPTPGTC